MTQAAVAPNLHEPLDVHGNGLAQIAFDHAVPLDDVPDANDLIFGEILDLGADVDACLLADRRRPAPADAEDICESDLHPLVNWQIHSRNSSQSKPPNSQFWILDFGFEAFKKSKIQNLKCSTLPLLVLGIGALDVHHSLAADDLALGTDSFHRCTHFHDTHSTTIRLPRFPSPRSQPTCTDKRCGPG
jgi:hypothetical protein